MGEHAMAIKSMRWTDDGHQDIHVLRGQTSRNLLQTLLFTDDSGMVTAESYFFTAPTHNDVNLRFKPLFVGAIAPGSKVYSGHGVDVDITTGQVTVAATSPGPHSPNNFIIEVEAENLTGGKKFYEKVRIHIHKSVTAIALTPHDLTIRPKGPTRIDTEFTYYRFTLRALFDNATMGDLTQNHGVHWEPASNVSHPGGHLMVAPGDFAGRIIEIRATLPPSLGGLSTTAKLHVAPAWSAEPSIPKAELIPDGGLPGTSLPEKSVNILIMGDGFSIGDQPAFQTHAIQIVHELKTSRLLRPFDVLSDSMNYWRVSVPADESGISIRCEVYTFEQNGKKVAWCVPAPIKPPITGDWKIEHLIYAVGLPVPADRGKSHAQILDDWDVLFGPEPRAKGSDLIDTWLSYSTRTFIEELDGFPGMALGEPPAAKAAESASLNLHPFRATRPVLDRFFAVLQDKDGTTAAGANIGSVWSGQSAALTFNNYNFIVVLSCFAAAEATIGLARAVSS
jgi:hypothetical protein